MRLLRLQLTNFRQHEATDLTFTNGLTGIIGANGSGKSTLLEAIGFALYGVSAVRGKRDTIRRRQAQGRAKVEVVLEFELGGHHHRIVRGLTQAELLVDGRTIANSTGTVAARVAHLLGMDRTEFFNTYFTGQKDLAVMAAMGSTERGKFLSQVLGYEHLRDAQDRMRVRRSACRSELVGLEQGMADPSAIEREVQQAQQELAAARQALESAQQREAVAREQQVALEPDWEAALARRSAWESLDGERRTVEQRVAEARAALETLDRELAVSLHAANQLQEVEPRLGAWDALVAERDRLDLAAAAWAIHSETRARAEEAERRRQALEAEQLTLPDPEAVAALATERTALVKLRQDAHIQVEERRTRWTQDRQESDTLLAQSREQYRDLKEQRDHVATEGAAGICPTCGRPLGEGAEATLGLLNRQLEEVSIRGQYLRQRHEQLRTPPPEIQELEDKVAQSDRDLRRLTEAQGQLQARLQRREAVAAELEQIRRQAQRQPESATAPLSYDQVRHEMVRSAVAALEPDRRLSDQLRGVAARAEALGQQAATAEEKATQAEAALAAVDQRLAALQWDPVAFADLDGRRQDLVVAQEAAARDRVGAAVTMQGAERMLERAVTHHQELVERVAAAQRLAQEVALLDELDRAYTDLRHALNVQVRPELAERGSRLLRHLTQGRYDDLELDEHYVPVVVDSGEVLPVLSGGEEDIVNLVLRLAISQMIAERAGQPLSLLVLDEIFGSLDDERRAGVLTLLSSLADRFPQVVLITHVESMREAFDCVFRVAYDVERGVSTVREEQVGVQDAA